MKELADGTLVSARTYYYLLDFNERYQWNYIRINFEKKRLMDLNIQEYIQLFEHATKTDLQELSS